MGRPSIKTLALLIQLPPSLQIFEGLENLRNLVSILDNRFRYAVEVRHTSWFQDLAYNFFETAPDHVDLFEVDHVPLFCAHRIDIIFLGEMFEHIGHSWSENI
jgi:uncharacterized protein YecE (DUF72 family)